MADYEKLGAFYLGRPVDEASGEPKPEPFLYDAKDLTTHAVCVGMTGSGKTGLAVTLIEEAAIDGIPVIAIDPKGDLGNLLLTFPELRAKDFRPWIDEGDAARKGNTPDEHAKWTADLWKNGLKDWDQGADRIQRFADSAQRAIYTPGSQAGRPLAVLKSFDAPNEAVLEDEDAFRERVLATTSGLLALLGIAADPIRSREHILLSTLFDHAWRQGQSLDLPTLIQQIQSPPVTRIGVMELNTFYPASDRFGLAMSLNSLMASPSFAAWSAGEPLDIGKLLYTSDGKPRLSIISIAHLSDAERMFLVTSLLNEVVAWMRGQPGSRTLRAMLYMDEVFGYLPPTANPPSKIPMLTLLKQARAFGLGVVLATQNPVDLDYKALSNAGTWFLGRLQTERDKARVLEGLEGASSAAGAKFDRSQMERTLAGLDSRVFLMNNVHEDAPTVFHTRWALSYLAGPLTRKQIKALATRDSEEQSPPRAKAKDGIAKGGGQAARGAKRTLSKAANEATSIRPVLAEGIRERFAPVVRAPNQGDKLVYRPSLRAVSAVHYTKSSVDIDHWIHLAIRAPLEATVTDPWAAMESTGASLPSLSTVPATGASFAPLPASASSVSSYAKWAKQLKTRLYRTKEMRVLRCKKPKLSAEVGESDGEFKGRLQSVLREERDLTIEKLRKKYAPKLERLRDRIKTAEQKVEKEREQYEHQRGQTLISIGATVVGAIFGRKLIGSRSVGRATTAARGIGRATRERGDIGRAEDKLEDLRDDLEQLEEEFQNEISALRVDIDLGDLPIDEVQIRPRKSDLSIDQILLVWEPWNINEAGVAAPAFSQ